MQRDLIWWTRPEANPDTSRDVVCGGPGILQATEGDFTRATLGCPADNLPTNSIELLGVLGTGDGFWFLARMVDQDPGVGTYDEPSGSRVGSRDAEIDASPVACP